MFVCWISKRDNGLFVL
jgi:hypothetical protein